MCERGRYVSWREWLMLALRFLSVFVGDQLAGQQIRMYGINPRQFSQPVGFFRVRLPPRCATELVRGSYYAVEGKWTLCAVV